MPESLMVGALVGAVYAMWRYHEEPSTKRLIVAAAVSALALFVKPGICFWQIFAAFVFLEVRRLGFKGALGDVRAYAFAALSLSPVVLWYAYGAYWEGFLSGQVSQKVLPRLLLQSFFWQGWFEQIGYVVGYVAFFGAILGFFFARAGAQKALLLGLWAGYLLFGLTFTFHVSTHDYYSLQLIPVVALSLGPVVARALDYAKNGGPVLARSAVLLLLVSAALLSAAEHREKVLGIAEQGRGTAFPGSIVGSALVADYEARVETYTETGRIVGQGETILHAPDFGWPLVYHGRLSPPAGFWPPPGWEDAERSAGRPQPSPEERLDALVAEHSPDYFVVVRRFTYYGTEANFRGKEYRQLRRLLRARYPVAARTGDYVVFDLRRGKGPP
jgi:hypothetical protein